MELEQLADNVLTDFQNGRLRLWLTSLRDAPEAFGPWAGLVRLRAEALSGQWQPARPELLQRLRACALEDLEDIPRPNELLLPMAADALEADLLRMGVPKDLAARAREIFTFEAPVAQWRI